MHSRRRERRGSQLVEVKSNVMWDSATGRLVGPRLPIADSPILTFGKWSGGQFVLASAEYSGQVKLWDPFSGKQIGSSLRGHTGPVGSSA